MNEPDNGAPTPQTQPLFETTWTNWPAVILFAMGVVSASYATVEPDFVGVFPFGFPLSVVVALVWVLLALLNIRRRLSIFTDRIEVRGLLGNTRELRDCSQVTAGHMCDCSQVTPGHMCDCSQVTPGHMCDCSQVTAGHGESGQWGCLQVLDAPQLAWWQRWWSGSGSRSMLVAAPGSPCRALFAGAALTGIPLPRGQADRVAAVLRPHSQTNQD